MPTFAYAIRTEAISIFITVEKNIYINTSPIFSKESIYNSLFGKGK